jgi:hypothetical protein
LFLDKQYFEQRASQAISLSENRGKQYLGEYAVIGPAVTDKIKYLEEELNR